MVQLLIVKLAKGGSRGVAVNCQTSKTCGSKGAVVSFQTTKNCSCRYN